MSVEESRRTVSPSRLIKVWKDDQCVRAQPVEEFDMSMTPKYATLSHCWGPVRFRMLTSSCLEEHKVSIPIERLSQTFRDALEVVVDLEVPYIWIDSLCIIQDSK